MKGFLGVSFDRYEFEEALAKAKCRVGIHEWGSLEYEEPAYVHPQRFFSSMKDDAFPLATVIEESKGPYTDYDKCRWCGAHRPGAAQQRGR